MARWGGRRLTVIGHGTVPSSGLKRGAVVNIERTVRSIRTPSAGRAPVRLEDRQGVRRLGGAQVESFNSNRPGVRRGPHPRGQPGRHPGRRAGQDDPVPSNREVLHVGSGGFTVDGQEGVKDPLGMSALRLEVEAHIVPTAPQTAVQNLMMLRPGGVRSTRSSSTRSPPGGRRDETERELGVAVADIGAGTIDLAMFNEGSPFRTSVLPSAQLRDNDIAIGSRRRYPRRGAQVQHRTAT